MPGFFETLERDDEANRLARALAAGCPRCERALLPVARRQVWRETSASAAIRGVLRGHGRHAASEPHLGTRTDRSDSTDRPARPVGNRASRPAV